MKRKKIFDGKRLHVYTELKKMPDGKNICHEGVDHPGASLIVPFVGDKIVFIRQYRAIIDKYIWELPAGVLEEGETPYHCAKREVVEETGYKVKNLKKIGHIYTSPGFCNEIIHIYKADCCDFIGLQNEEDEFIKTKLLSKQQVLDLFLAGKINDSKTIAALGFSGVI